MDKTNNMLTVGGLYSGVGGIELAFKKSGFKISWSTDNDPNVKKTYELNAGKDKNNFIGPINIEELLENKSERIKLKKVDVLTAGFPCQPFSLAGYRSGIFECPQCKKNSISNYPKTDKNLHEFWACSDEDCEYETQADFKKIHSRGNSFFRVMHALDIIKPRAIFLENVRNFENHDNGGTLDTLRKEFIDRGYSFHHDVLNAADYTDIPQNRERIFIVGFKKDNKNKLVEKYKENLPSTIKKFRRFDEFIDVHIKKQGEFEKLFYDETFMKGDPDKVNELFDVVSKKETFYQWRRVYVRPNKNNLCPALTANMGTGGHNVPLIYTGSGVRKLTPKECFNLQGMSDFKLPDDVSSAQLYKQAGNSVSMPLVKKLADAIKKALI